MNYLERITIDPEICHGKPCIRGMRWPVEVLLDLLGSGMTHAEILSDHPELEHDDITASLHYAKILSRIREIESDCIQQHGEFDWEKLNPNVQDEYDSLCIQMNEMQDSGEDLR